MPGCQRQPAVLYCIWNSGIFCVPAPGFAGQSGFGMRSKRRAGEGSIVGRWIDRKGRIGGLIHWLDLLLFLAALAVIVRAVISSLPPAGPKDTGIIRFEVRAPDLPEKQVENIGVGQWVQDARSGAYLGKIIRKDVIPARDYLPVAGEYQLLSHPEKKEMILLIERWGTVREREGIYLGKEVIRAGEERTFQTLYAVFQGRIDRIFVDE